MDCGFEPALPFSDFNRISAIGLDERLHDRVEESLALRNSSARLVLSRVDDSPSLPRFIPVSNVGCVVDVEAFVVLFVIDDVLRPIDFLFDTDGVEDVDLFSTADDFFRPFDLLLNPDDDKLLAVLFLTELDDDGDDTVSCPSSSTLHAANIASPANFSISPPWDVTSSTIA